MRRPDAEKFWARVDSSAGPDGYWPWLGPVHSNGYGAASGNWLAHRAAYALAIDDIPAGHCVFRLCEDPKLCCNPLHLCCGTAQLKEQYKILRGRHVHGDKHWARRDRAKALRHLRGER